jgi:hypothetical protein
MSTDSTDASSKKVRSNYIHSSVQVTISYSLLAGIAHSYSDGMHVRGLIPGRGKRFFSFLDSVQPGCVWPIQPPIQGVPEALSPEVKQPGREANLLPSTSAEVKNDGAIPPLFGLELSPLGTAATSGLLYQPQMIDEGDCGAIGGMKIGRGNRSTRRKPAPAPL